MATTPAAPVGPDRNQADARICRRRLPRRSVYRFAIFRESATRNIDADFLEPKAMSSSENTLCGDSIDSIALI